jgi:WD40 repeat protein
MRNCIASNALICAAVAAVLGAPTQSRSTGDESARHADPTMVVETGHASYFVDSVRFSPDGRIIATCGCDSIVLWNAETGKEIRKIGTPTFRHSRCLFSPNGKQIASWHDWCKHTDNRIHLWDVETGRLVRTFQGHDDDTSVVQFSPDGKRIASGGSDKTIRLWDAETGSQIRTFAGYRSGVEGLCFSPSGKKIAGGGTDSIRLWDVETGRSVRTLAEDVDSSLCWSGPSPRRIAAGTGASLMVWDLETGKDIGTFVTHGMRCDLSCLSPDGKRIAGWSGDSINVWDVDTGKMILTLPHPEESAVSASTPQSEKSLCFSPDGQELASADRWFNVKVWDARTGREIRTLRGNDCEIRYSPDGKRIASATSWRGYWPDGTRVEGSGGAGGYLILWDAKTGRKIQAPCAFPVSSACFSPDGTKIASVSELDTIGIWDLRAGRPVRSFPGQVGRVGAVGFSPDGESFAIGSADLGSSFTLKLWDVRTGREDRAQKASPRLFSASKIGIEGSDDTISVWDEKAGRAISAIHEYKSYSLSFSPNRKLIASWGAGNTIKLWDVETGGRLWALEGTSGTVALCFSPDSTKIAGWIGDLINVWDVNTGKVIRTLQHPGGSAVSASTLQSQSSLCFSPDGQELAGVGGEDGRTILLWDVETGKQIRVFAGHTGRINALDFSPDGKQILSGSNDRTMKLWDAETGACLATLASFDDGGWVVATPGGPFDGNPSGMKHLHWVEDGRVVSPEKHFAKYRTPGLLARLAAKS